jgi:hypothetical protein
MQAFVRNGSQFLLPAAFGGIFPGGEVLMQGVAVKLIERHKPEWY